MINTISRMIAAKRLRTQRLRRTIKKSIAALLSVIALATVSYAQPQLLDKIVAVVGDTAISSRELATAMKHAEDNLMRQERDIPPPQVLLPQVLEQLIVVKLQLQEAERRGIAIDEIALDQMLEQIAANNGITLAEMKEQIEQQQGSYNEMRESVRQELIISQLRQRVINGIAISEPEIEIALRKLNARTLFRFSYFSAELPQAAGERDKLQQRFHELREKMLYANDFSEAATAEALESDINYRRSGFRNLNQLPGLIQKKVLSMNIGDITPVIKTASTIYLFRLDDRQAKQLPNTVTTQYHIRHILLRTDAMHSDSYIRKKLLAIKRRIENGASFSRLAKKYSQDPGSGFKGGDLGWLSTGGLEPTFAQYVENAPRREIIGPFATHFGQHLLEVLAERQQDISSNVQRQNVIAQLRKEKSTEAINEWLLRLRESEHIDIRL